MEGGPRSPSQPAGSQAAWSAAPSPSPPAHPPTALCPMRPHPCGDWKMPESAKEKGEGQSPRRAPGPHGALEAGALLTHQSRSAVEAIHYNNIR